MYLFWSTELGIMIHLFAETALLSHCWKFLVGFVVTTPPTLFYLVWSFFSFWSFLFCVLLVCAFIWMLMMTLSLAFFFVYNIHSQVFVFSNLFRLVRFVSWLRPISTALPLNWVILMDFSVLATKHNFVTNHSFFLLVAPVLHEDL